MESNALFKLLASRAENEVTKVGSQFFDANGKLLVRCFGSNKLSAIEMRNLGLEPTTMTFSGGYFLRVRQRVNRLE